MNPQAPILISIPHSGTDFPHEVRDQYTEKALHHPKDTDWFIEQLYDFAPQMGIECVMAPYSRYLIDLNRDPSSQSLYSDGRSETSLIPSTTFLGESILNFPLEEDEIKRRLEKYYWPYYNNIKEKLNSRIEKFGHALLFDAHSIKRNVKTIRETAFPDMILGNADETSAGARIINSAITSLRAGPYQVNHNDPFKGGHITRYFGNLNKNIHALQLEMSQDIYMNEEKTIYDDKKATIVRTVLVPLFENLLIELDKNEDL